MILPRVAPAQFFQISVQESVVAHVLPVFQHARQPRAVDLFGRCDALQEIQRVSLARKISARPALLAVLKVTGVILRHCRATGLRPCRQLLRRLGQITRQLSGAGHLLAQENLRLRTGISAVAVEQIVQFSIAPSGNGA
ncbi:hypothetical protein D3C84_667430 [compost metagenome]